MNYQNQVVEFTYTNANGETKDRVVYVEHDDGYELVGHDFAASGETRRFKYYRIQGGRIIHNTDFRIVDLTGLVSNDVFASVSKELSKRYKYVKVIGSKVIGVTPTLSTTKVSMQSPLKFKFKNTIVTLSEESNKLALNTDGKQSTFDDTKDGLLLAFKYISNFINNK